MSTEHERGDDVPPVRLRLDDRAGPAPRLPLAQGRTMVERALDEWEGTSTPVTRSRRSTTVWARRLAVAAGVLLVGAGSAAAAYWWTQPRAAAGAESPASAGSAPSERANATSADSPSSSPTPGEARSQDADSSAEAEAGTRQDAPAEAERDGPQARGARRHDPPPSRDAEDWMQRANRLRAEGHWARAERAYRHVYEQHPTRLSAYVARVAAASLQLEHLDRPRRARRVWERALEMRSGGALEVEILQGIAAASRELGDKERELEALHKLLDSHPGTRAATRARRRLDAIRASE